MTTIATAVESDIRPRKMLKVMRHLGPAFIDCKEANRNYKICHTLFLNTYIHLFCAKNVERRLNCVLVMCNGSKSINCQELIISGCLSWTKKTMTLKYFSKCDLPF